MDELERISKSAIRIPTMNIPAMDIGKHLREIFDSAYEHQEMMRKRLEEQYSTKRLWQEYLSDLLAQNKAMMHASLAHVPQMMVHPSWQALSQTVSLKSELEKCWSQVYKHNWQTETLFSQFSFSEVLSSIRFNDKQREVFRSFHSCYADIARDIEGLHAITQLPRFAFPDASRTNLFLNWSILHVHESRVELEPLDQNSIDNEIQVVDDSIRLFGKRHPDLAGIIEGAKQSCYALNADRSRHVLVSLREAFTHLLHRLSPERDLSPWIGSQDNRQELLHKDKPTRKARFLYICRNINHGPLKKLVEQDVQATLELISVFQRIHAIDPSLTEAQLKAIIAKTECSILFILRLLDDE